MTAISRFWNARVWTVVGRSDGRTASLIVLLGILTRLVVLPWAETTNGDAVTRGHWALQWAHQPHWIGAGVWLPFSTYVTGIGLKLLHWPVWTPILLNILLISLAAVCLWQFTRREFEAGDSVSLFVAIAFLMAPLAFRTSLMALSEPLTVLMLGLMLLCLSAARRPNGRFYQALLGGFCLTLAAAIRYEIWVLIPCFAIALWRKPRFFLAFGLMASIFPLVWMVDSFRLYSDPFFPLTYQSIDTAHVLAINGGMTLTRRIVRLFFFPMTLLFGMTFGVFTFAGWGAVQAVLRRSKTWVWLVPFGMLITLLSYKGVTGTLNMEGRYSLNLAFLLLPFTAEFFKPPFRGLSFAGRTWSGRRLQQLTLCSIFPLGYILYLTQPLAPRLLRGISRSPAEQIAPIPRLPQQTRALVELLRRHQRHHQHSHHGPQAGSKTQDLSLGTEPVWIWGFESNQVENLVLFHNQIPVDRGHMLSVTLNSKELQRTQRFSDRHPQGLLLIEARAEIRAVFPRLGASPLGQAVLQLPGVGPFQLEPLERGERYELYRYRRL